MIAHSTKYLLLHSFNEGLITVIHYKSICKHNGTIEADNAALAVGGVI